MLNILHLYYCNITCCKNLNVVLFYLCACLSLLFTMAKGHIVNDIELLLCPFARSSRNSERVFQGANRTSLVRLNFFPCSIRHHIETPNSQQAAFGPWLI